MNEGQLIRSSGWLALAAVLSRSGTLLASVLVVRWLGKDAYGLFALTQTTVLMAGGFLGAGFGMAATKLIAEVRSSSSQEAGGAMLLFELSTLVTAIIAAAALVACRNVLSVDLLQEPRLAELLSLSAPLLVATSLNLYQAGVLAGLESYRETAVANAISGLLSLPITVAGVWFGGLHGAIVAQTISMALSCAIYQRWISAGCRASGIQRRWLEAIAQRRILWQLGLPTMMLSAINAPTDWLSFAILSRHPNGISEIGIYSVANQWCLVLRFLPLMMGAALLPMAARTATECPNRVCLPLFLSGLRLSALVCAPFALMIIALSPMIMRWYGRGFAEHWDVLALLAACGMAIALQTTADRFLIGLGAAWTSFWLSLGRSTILIGSTLALLDSGANGLAIARLAAFAVSAVACSGLAMVLIGRRTQLQYQVNGFVDPREPLVGEMRTAA
jgi:O-antigen/teichoic acid export membrane protein